MVRFTHHDSGFQCFWGIKAALCLTENPCHPDRREGSRWSAAKRRRASTKIHVILTGGRDLTVFHGDIGEMVRFTHHDTGFQWFLQRMAA
jgi:hypothetical protein